MLRRAGLGLLVVLLLAAAVAAPQVLDLTGGPVPAPSVAEFRERAQAGYVEGEGEGEGERAIPGGVAQELQRRAYPQGFVDDRVSIKAREAFEALPSRTPSSALPDAWSTRRKRAAATITAQWSEIGPTSLTKPVGQSFASPASQAGRISALAVKPGCSAAACTLFAGAAGGGLWKTGNALAEIPAWQPAMNGIPTNSIGSITFDPNDDTGNTLYVGTGEAADAGDDQAGRGLYKSVNGGQTFTPVAGAETIGLNRSIGAVLVKPGDANTIWIGTARGRTGGSATLAGLTTAPDVQQMGVYKSEDGGATFTLSKAWEANSTNEQRRAMEDSINGGVHHLELDPANADTVYAAAYGHGIWRQSVRLDGDDTWRQVYVPEDADTANSARAEFDLVRVADNATRAYVGDGSNGTKGSFFRAMDVDVAAADLVDATPANTNVWEKTSSETANLDSDAGDGGRGAHDYCGEQCTYDNAVMADASDPDVVFLGGDIPDFGEKRSNGRSVIRSDNAGGDWTDWTADYFHSLQENGDDPLFGSHPDTQVFEMARVGNKTILFIGSDGGVVRDTGDVANLSGFTGDIDAASAECERRVPEDDDSRTLCKKWLSKVPERFYNMNEGLSTAQFQSISADPRDPLGTLLGGLQDNGTVGYAGALKWTGLAQGDGGASGFDAQNSNIRITTGYNADISVNLEGNNLATVARIGDPLEAVKESEGLNFYPMVVVDPRRAGSIFYPTEQKVWRTQNNGGEEQYLRDNCMPDSQPAGAPVCGNFVPISPDLTAAGGTRDGGSLVALGRSTADDDTLWAGTSTGRLFISKNANATDPETVEFTRLDDGGTAAADDDADKLPNRVPTAFATDPDDPNRAWISYSGYDAYTESTPGHVFELRYNGTGTGLEVFDLSYNLGDQVVRGLAFHGGPNGPKDLYAATDFGVSRLADKATAWADAGAANLPRVGVSSLTIAPFKRTGGNAVPGAATLYAATHGRGAWRLVLASDPVASIVGPATATVGSASSYTASAVTAEDRALTYTWTLPGGGTASGSTLSFTPTSAGDKTLSVTVTDADGRTGTATKTVTVSAAKVEEKKDTTTDTTTTTNTTTTGGGTPTGSPFVPPINLPSPVAKTVTVTCSVKKIKGIKGKSVAVTSVAKARGLETDCKKLAAVVKKAVRTKGKKKKFTASVLTCVPKKGKKRKVAFTCASGNALVTFTVTLRK